MPLQRRVPKFGFVTLKSGSFAEIRLNELNKIISSEPITIDVLKKHNIIDRNVTGAKVILSGELKITVVLKGIAATAGARKVIETLGGKVED